VADEILTPDSSRFALIDEISLGKEPPSLDKEVFRSYAEGVWATGIKVPLVFPRSVIEAGQIAYHELLRTLTGLQLSKLQVELGMC